MESTLEPPANFVPLNEPTPIPTPEEAPEVDPTEVISRPITPSNGPGPSPVPVDVMDLPEAEMPDGGSIPPDTSMESALRSSLREALETQ